MDFKKNTQKKLMVSTNKRKSTKLRILLKFLFQFLLRSWDLEFQKWNRCVKNLARRWACAVSHTFEHLWFKVQGVVYSLFVNNVPVCGVANLQAGPENPLELILG